MTNYCLLMYFRQIFDIKIRQHCLTPVIEERNFNQKSSQYTFLSKSRRLTVISLLFSNYSNHNLVKNIVLIDLRQKKRLICNNIICLYFQFDVVSHLVFCTFSNEFLSIKVEIYSFWLSNNAREGLTTCRPTIASKK